MRSLSLLSLFLVFSTIAVVRLCRSLDWRLVAGSLAAVSLITWFLYWRDKRRAERDEWRTPESTLHLCELLGGWAAAFVAQRTLRHKISKGSFQNMFWLVAILHQLVSIDFLTDWHFLRALLKLVGLEL